MRLEPDRWYESISHVRLEDKDTCKVYYIPKVIYEEMLDEQTWEKQLGVLAKYRLDPAWGMFIRVISRSDRR